MPIRRDLLNEIRNALGPAITPSHTEASDVSDIYEGYLFALVIEAARAEGAAIRFTDVSGGSPTTFVFRTSPGFIYSTRQPYTFAVVDFPNKPLLEAHLGVRILGKSRVLHEGDVCVMRKAEAERCRENHSSPRSSKVELMVECKFYSTNIPLALGRSFVGLASDMSATKSFFAVNTASESVARFLAIKKMHWTKHIVPDSHNEVDKLRNSVQTLFSNYGATH